MKCTPEYNAETKKLMQEHEDLKRIAKSFETGDFGPAIRAKAKDIAKDKSLSAEEVANKTHEYINQYADHSPREVSDAISGYGHEPEPKTLTEDQQRMKDIKSELREASKKADNVPSPQEKARQTALKRELKDVQDRIASGNYDKPQKTPPEWSPATKKMQSDLAAEKLKLEKLKHSLALKNRSLPEKIKDLTLAASRSAILLGYHVLGKLAAYSGTETLTAPLRAIVSEAYRHIPGIKDVFEKAPVAGGGWLNDAQGKNFSTLFNQETRKAMRDRLIRGFSDEDARLGNKKDFQTAHPLLEMSGRLHEMIKTPVERAGFEMANAHYLAADLRKIKGENPGISDEKAMDLATSPSAIASREAKAYTIGKERVLKGDSELVNAWKAGLRMLKGKEGDSRYRLTRGLVSFAEYMEPIVKVPANLVSEAFKYTPAGIGKALLASKELKNMTEAEAEYIADNLTKGTLGSLVMAAYWYGAADTTGYYQEGDSKKHPNRQPEQTTIGGVTLGKWFSHHPITSIGQMVGTAKRVYNETKSGGEAALKATTGMLDSLPFVNTLEYNGQALKDLPHFGKFVGEEAANFVPQVVKEAAKDTDKAKGRKVTTGTDVFKAAIPGLREQLPPRG